MKKLILTMTILMLTSCSIEEKMEMQKKVTALSVQKNQISNDVRSLLNDKRELEESIALTTAKKDGKELIYLVTINIKQSHFTLDLKKHIKDSLNDIDMQIPVSEEFYNSSKVGDKLNDGFRVGSFLTEGSIGSWNIKITKKDTIIK